MEARPRVWVWPPLAQGPHSSPYASLGDGLSSFRGRHRWVWLQALRCLLVYQKSSSESSWAAWDSTKRNVNLDLRGIETGRQARPSTRPLENALVTLARREVVFELSIGQASKSRCARSSGTTDADRFVSGPRRASRCVFLLESRARRAVRDYISGGDGYSDCRNHLLISLNNRLIALESSRTDSSS